MDPQEKENYIMIAKRGRTTFANKSILVSRNYNTKNEIGGLLIVNNCSIWPFVMHDSKNEIQASFVNGKDKTATEARLPFPVFMMKEKEGDRLIEILERETGNCSFIGIVENEKRNDVEDCIICQETYEIDDIVVTLDCGHIFHRPCISKWIGIKESCPYCRTDIQTK